MGGMVNQIRLILKRKFVEFVLNNPVVDLVHYLVGVQYMCKSHYRLTESRCVIENSRGCDLIFSARTQYFVKPKTPQGEQVLLARL